LGGDHIDINGGIDLQASSASPFIIKLLSLNAGGARGPLAGFDKDAGRSWPIAAMTDSITNFDSSRLVLESAQFSNDLGGGVFLLETNGSLNIRFANNHPPQANAVALTRAAGTTLKIAVASLIADFTSDSDGDLRELLAISAPLNGGLITRDGPWLFYSPPTDDGDDSFSYTVCDVRSYRVGEMARTATATISITKVRSAAAARQISISGGVVSMTFAGIPGYIYDIERSIDLIAWEMIKTITNPETGVFSFTDDSPPPDAAYYRLRQH
jgi:hypothetical protein